MNGVCGIYVILFYPAFVLFQRFRTGEKNQINDKKRLFHFYLISCQMRGCGPITSGFVWSVWDTVLSLVIRTAVYINAKMPRNLQAIKYWSISQLIDALHSPTSLYNHKITLTNWQLSLQFSDVTHAVCIFLAFVYVTLLLHLSWSLCSTNLNDAYTGWYDVTESMVTIRSPFCGYNWA